MRSLEIRTQRILNNLIKQNQKLASYFVLKQPTIVSSAQSPTSNVYYLNGIWTCSVQCPASRVQSPEPRVQRRESSVESPASRVQRLGSRVQHPGIPVCPGSVETALNGSYSSNLLQLIS